jgi:hypothetical protein
VETADGEFARTQRLGTAFDENSMTLLPIESKVNVGSLLRAVHLLPFTVAVCRAGIFVRVFLSIENCGRPATERLEGVNSFVKMVIPPGNRFQHSL